MVFVDGDHRYEGVKRDLLLLKDFLVSRTPVLCHDYTNLENETGEIGVRQAVNEFVQAGYAELIGTFGCSALLLTTNQCSGTAIPKLTEQEFAAHKSESLWKICKTLYDTFDSSSNSLKNDDETVQQQLQQVRAELERSQAQIQAMESSKFWRIRLAWFKFKNLLGLDRD